MQVQPMIAVRDVAASRRWYCQLLDAASGHGGDEYDQIVRDGRLLLQLHAWDVHEHPRLGDPALPPGNGVLLWFQDEGFDAVVARATALGALVLQGPAVNPRARHRELWLRDPDGYAVVIAGAPGDLGSAAAP